MTSGPTTPIHAPVPQTVSSIPPAGRPDPSSGAPVVKMVGMILEGVGAVVSGLSLSFLIPVINGSSSNYQSSETALFNTLEAGIIIIGIGVIVLGIGAYLESRHR